jgi:hypothetical protein
MTRISISNVDRQIFLTSALISEKSKPGSRGQSRGPILFSFLFLSFFPQQNNWTELNDTKKATTFLSTHCRNVIGLLLYLGLKRYD